MKTIVIFLVLVFVLSIAGQKGKGQMVNPVFNGKPGNESVFNNETIIDYLNRNIEYPSESSSCCVQGTEVVKFTVTAKGKVADIKIINSVCKKMDREVIRTLETTNGKWAPAMKDGKPFDKQLEVSVEFKLHKTNDFVKMAKTFIQKGNKYLFVKNRPEKALKYYDCAVNLLPNNETVLSLRGLCRSMMGDNAGAMDDWARAKEIKERTELALKETDGL